MNKKKLLTDKTQKATLSSGQSARRALAIQLYSISMQEPLIALQRHMGHLSIDSTKRYIEKGPQSGSSRKS